MTQRHDRRVASRSRRASRVALIAALALGCGHGHGSAAVEGKPTALDRIRLPAGFTIALYAEGVRGARSLALSPAGTVFVGSREEGRVYALPDRNRDRRADAVRVIAEGLDEPNGVDVKGGALYVAEVSRVLRYDRIEDQLAGPRVAPPAVFHSGLPDERHHGWRYARFGPDGWLWIGIGAPCNACVRPDPFASLARIAPDGRRLEVYARGVRNTVGFDWQPGTGEPWFTDNGRDWMGDDRPPDELNRAPRAGMHFGFPHCEGGDLVDPDEARGRRCDEFEPPAAKLAPHVAALGLRFYRGTMFPGAYRGAVFIAEHGSWNRSKPIGYRVTVVDFASGKASNYRPFAEGWLEGGEAWGRPVDILEMPDGALLVSDDQAGAVYRVAYGGAP